MKKFIPLEDRVLAKAVPVEDRTRGGVYIPDSSKEEPIQAEIIAVGKGKTNSEGKLLPMSLEVGDRVVFAKWAGNKIKLDEEEYVVLREADIFGVLK